MSNFNESKKFKVNLHITRACNFKCKGCFAHFDHNDALSLTDWMNIIDNIASSNRVNAINFAGGEPLLYKNLAKLIEHCNDHGLKCSIITNGSLLTEKFLDKVANKLSILGISIDSFDDQVNLKLGRCSKNGQGFNFINLNNIAALLEQRNIDLKINTTISKLNYKEYMVDKLFKENSIIPKILKRWKILRMQKFVRYNSNNEMIFSNNNLLINKEQFNFFCQINKHNSMVIENSMVNSYIFVDNVGNLLDNSNYNEYIPIGDKNLLQQDFNKALLAYKNFNEELYAKRYSDS